MSTPSAMSRDPEESDRGFHDALRRMSSHATLPGQGQPAPQSPLAESGGGLGESSGLTPALGQIDPLSCETRASIARDEIERLEASLRWLQRQERPPRLALPPFPPLAPFEPPAAGDSERSELRSALSLEPARLAPPPQPPRSWQLPSAVAIGCALAAAIGYYVSAGGWWSRPLVPATEVQASVPDQVVAAWVPKQELKSRLIEARDDEVPATAQSEPSTTAPQGSEPPPAPVAVAVLAPAAPAIKSRPETAIRALDDGEIALLVQRAQQFIATGDLVTARILFQRAAQAGDAAAAVALGATYDPVVLARLGVVGISPDVEKARSWYRTAESLGSSEATRRLAGLANR